MAAIDCFPAEVVSTSAGVSSYNSREVMWPPNVSSSLEELGGLMAVQLSFFDGSGNGSVTASAAALSQPTTWETRSPLPAAADLCLAAFLILIDILAVSLNLFVIVISVKNRKSLHSSDAFVVFLACSDLGHPLLGYPIGIIAALQHGWNFGYLGCQVHGFLGFLFGTSSMTCLACMSVSRFVSVAKPNFARAHGSKLAVALLSFSLVNAVFWAACPLLGWGRYDLEPYRTSCTLQWDYPDTSYVTACFVGCLALPALLMAVSYGHITRLALATGQRRRRWAAKSQSSATVAASESGSGSGSGAASGLSKPQKAWSTQEWRLFKLTITMCTVFVLAWTPYSVFAMLTAYTQTLHVPLAFTPLAALTAKCSHVLDPLIYCALNNKFRRLFPKVSFFRKRPGCDLKAEGNTTTTVPLNTVNVSLADCEGGGESKISVALRSSDLSDTN